MEMESGQDSSAHRTFYQLPAAPEEGTPTPAATSSRQPADPDALRRYVREQVIGRSRTFLGPFGPNRAVYCDYTASGKALHFIEDYIRNEVLPSYANTHTTSTHSALQTTSFRDEARQMVRNCVQASEHDAVVFCGSGTTSAVHKLIKLLALPRPPLVLVGPHEHHSNLLPWRDTAAQVVRVPEEPSTGCVSLPELEARLGQLSAATAADGRQLIACFSAASNVTGLAADETGITAAVHRHGGLVFWDYATAAPYTKMVMNPVVPSIDPGLTAKDAIFFSPHKFIGGVQTPGVLVIKKRLVQNAVPDGGGGGTVFFVRREHHRYLQDIETREEGGTPGIVESVRAGLVLQLKDSLGADNIRAWDDAIVTRFLRELRSIPQLSLLGPRSAPPAGRLPVFSFLVATPSGAFLHHNFVTALLNDVFGVETRGGCACAGPYAQDLLGIDETLAAKYEQMLVEDSRLDRSHLRRQGEYSSYELLRPGFTRITLSYVLAENELSFTINAIKLVSQHGWKLLPQYRVNPETGEWRHHSNMVLKERKWLGDVKYTSGRMEYRQRANTTQAPDFQATLQRAMALIDNAKKSCPKLLADHQQMFDAEAAKLRWFLLPDEAKMMLDGQPVTLTPPFKPKVYKEVQVRSVAPLRRRAMSESHDSSSAARQAAAAAALASSQVPAQPVPVPASTNQQRPPSGAALPHYAGSLDRERGRTAGRVPGAATVVTGSPVQVIPGSPQARQLLKQRASSASTDRRLSDTRFLAQELHNLFFNRPAGVRRQSSAGQLSSSWTGGQAASPTASPPPSFQPAGPRRHSLNIACSPPSGASLLSTSGVAPVPPSTVSAVPSVAQIPELSAVSARSAPSPSAVCSGLRSSPDGAESRVPSETDHKIVGTDSDSRLPSQKVVSGAAGDGVSVSATSGVSSKTVTSVGDRETPAAQSPQPSRVSVSSTEAASPVQPPRAAPVVHSEVKWHAPPRNIFKKTLDAIEEFGMLRADDRVLVCLSGGKDSLSLLHTLHQYQYVAASRGASFHLAAVTVDPQSSAYDPRPLVPYLAKLNVPYFYEVQGILKQAEEVDCSSICSFCSRMKRGRLYAAARRQGYNVLAFGQHLDDITESFLMSIFHNGRLRTMKACYTVTEQDLRVIRPFIYVREKELRQFAESRKLPVIPENCPACFEQPKERHRVKQLLAQQEVLFPHLYESLRTALRPLYAISRTGLESRLFGRALPADDEEEDMFGNCRLVPQQGQVQGQQAQLMAAQQQLQMIHQQVQQQKTRPKRLQQQLTAALQPQIGQQRIQQQQHPQQQHQQTRQQPTGSQSQQQRSLRQQQQTPSRQQQTQTAPQQAQQQTSPQQLQQQTSPQQQSTSPQTLQQQMQCLFQQQQVLQSQQQTAQRREVEQRQ